MKFRNNDPEDVIFEDIIIEDVTFYIHPKEGGRYGCYLKIREKDAKKLSEIFKRNDIKFEIQKKTSLF